MTIGDDGVLTVVKPIPKSPAYKAGIKAGDKIISINGKSTFAMSFSRIIKIMKDRPGTKVSLKVLSKNSLNSHSLVLKREVIFVDSVEKKIVKYANKKYLHLIIETFASRTSDEVKKYILDAKKDHSDLDGIILDLRQNPGGLLNQAVKVSDLFIDNGLIVKIKGKLKDTKYAHKNKIWDGPLVVLIDEITASASEIVSAALQDNNKAIILGVPSYGKATVQTLFELPSKEALKLTIARYYPPNGLSLDQYGVMPDLTVHPIYVKRNNTNLMGVGRYHDSKLFAYNFLDGNRDNKRTPSPYHLYFLSRNKNHANQFSIRLSLFLLNRLSPEWRKSSKKRDLLINNKYVRHRLQFLNHKIAYRMEKLYQVTWNKNFFHKNGRDLSLEVGHDLEREGYFEQGKEMALHYNIRNYDVYDTERVSLFIKEAGTGTLLKEVLIGKISKEGSKEGVVNLAIPNVLGAKEGLCHFRIGLAVDGVPILNSVTPYSVKVRPFQAAQVKTSIRLSEAEGKVKGKIEPKENAFIKLRLVNSSMHDASKVSLKFVNLSGKQISLGSFPKVIKKLRAGESRELTIKVKGAKYLLDKKLPFGVLMMSNSFAKPVKKQLTLPSVPNLDQVSELKPLKTVH